MISPEDQEGIKKEQEKVPLVQRPFSTGEVYIATPNPFDDPVINPNYFSHPVGKLTNLGVRAWNIHDLLS